MKKAGKQLLPECLVQARAVNVSDRDLSSIFRLTQGCYSMIFCSIYPSMHACMHASLCTYARIVVALVHGLFNLFLTDQARERFGLSYSFSPFFLNPPRTLNPNNGQIKGEREGEKTTGDVIFSCISRCVREKKKCKSSEIMYSYGTSQGWLPKQQAKRQTRTGFVYFITPTTTATASSFYRPARVLGWISTFYVRYILYYLRMNSFRMCVQIQILVYR